MAISYRIDEAKGVVITTATGVLTDDDLLQHKERLTVEPRWKPGMRELSDIRRIERLEVTALGVKSLVSHDERSADRLRSFRLAIVTADEVVFGMGRMYQMMTERNVPHVRIFRDMDEAIEWLDLS